jgi:hypothetical protein
MPNQEVADPVVDVVVDRWHTAAMVKYPFLAMGAPKPSCRSPLADREAEIQA